MRMVFILFIFVSCSHVTKKPHEDSLVSVHAALNHIHASYLKGCVDAHRKLKRLPSFEHCRDKATEHRDEVRSIMESGHEDIQ